MKTHRSMLAAVLMTVVSISGTGCKKMASLGAPEESAATPAQASAAPAAPEAPATAQTPAPEPVKAASITGGSAPIGPIAASPSPGILTGPTGAPFVRPALPPLRMETPGRAPSAHHVFRRGFWQWDAARVVYSWVPGYWEDQAIAAPMAPPPPRVEDPGPAPNDDCTFVRGYWRYDGHDYHWVPGHYVARRDAGDVRRPVFVKIGGRWVAKLDGRPEVKGSVTVSVGTRGHG